MLVSHFRSSVTVGAPGYRAVPGRRPEVTDVTEAEGRETYEGHEWASRFACVLRREAADRGPIEVVTALREQSQKSVAQKTAERHGHA